MYCGITRRSRSARGATLDTGGWLALTRPGLSPGKKHQASLGAPTKRRCPTYPTYRVTQCGLLCLVYRWPKNIKPGNPIKKRLNIDGSEIAENSARNPVSVGLLSMPPPPRFRTTKSRVFKPVFNPAEILNGVHVSNSAPSLLRGNLSSQVLFRKTPHSRLSLEYWPSKGVAPVKVVWYTYCPPFKDCSIAVGVIHPEAGPFSSHAVFRLAKEEPKLNVGKTELLMRGATWRGRIRICHAPMLI